MKFLSILVIVLCLYSCKDISKGATSAKMYTSIGVSHYKLDNDCVVIYLRGLDKFDCKDKNIRRMLNQNFDSHLFSHVKDNKVLKSYKYAILELVKSNTNKYGDKFNTRLRAYKKIDLDELRKYENYKLWERNSFDSYSFSDVLEAEMDEYKRRRLSVKTFLEK